jgi:hypothetical protein
MRQREFNQRPFLPTSIAATKPLPPQKDRNSLVNDGLTAVAVVAFGADAEVDAAVGVNEVVVALIDGFST